MATPKGTAIIINCAEVATGASVDIRSLERRAFQRATIRNSALLPDQNQFRADVADLQNRGYAIEVES
jgi:hypothetical protein